MTGRRAAASRAWPLAAAAIAIVVVLAAPAPAEAQCAMCRRALDSPEGRQMIAAFRGGILVLLAAPFAVFGTVATLAVRRFRRKPDAAA
jgi:hypothetical protein